MSTSGENFEGYISPQENPYLAEYLRVHSNIDPSAVLVLNYLPELIGGPKSGKFIIRATEATPDTPPDPSATIDLDKIAVPASGMKSFSDFFQATEAQADTQYDVALFEVQQALADAEETGSIIETLLVPDAVNSTAKGYFNRLTRLAQDTDKSIVIQIVDYDGERFSRFERFEPIRVDDITGYWDQRARESRVSYDGTIDHNQYFRYTVDGAYESDGSIARSALAGIGLPTRRTPLIFTTFEQLQRDYPGSPISDPAVWEVAQHDFELVSDKSESLRAERAYREERGILAHSIDYVASTSTDQLRQWLLGDNAPLRDKLPVIHELAAYGITNRPDDNNSVAARVILAKLGDKGSAQAILKEIQYKTGGYGSEPLTMLPLGIHLRHDPELLNAILSRVEGAINDGSVGTPDTLYLLGALYHSHDPRVGGVMAYYLTVPKHDIKDYAGTVLHAAARWMPDYVAALQVAPASSLRDLSLAAIQRRAAAFIDAHNQGGLGGIDNEMTFAPDHLIPMLFQFRNPEHQAILREAVLKQFKEGGSVLTDQTFEGNYLRYREQYGDLPEISRLLKSS